MIPGLRSRMSVKLAVLVLGCTTLVFALVLSYSYYSSREIILDEAEKNARNLSLSVARRIEQEFRAIAKVPENLAAFLEISRLDRDTLLQLIRRTVEDNREIFGSTVSFEPFALDDVERHFAPYYYKTKDGPAYEQIGSDTYDYFIKDWYYLPKVLKAPLWTNPYFDEGAGAIIMITYSCPFFERDHNGARGKLRGVVTADVSLEWLAKLVGSMQVGASGYCFIVSDTGAFVTHPRQDLIMSESIFSLAEDLHDPKLRAVGLSMTREDSGFADVGSTLIGQPAFLAYARIPSTGWALGAVFPRTELLAELNRLHRRNVFLAAVALALLLTVSLLVARSISRPLRSMAQATRKVAQGDLDIDLSDVRSRDEVGQLAIAFVQMAEGLKERDRIRNTFGRYLTREVVNRLLESKDGLRLGGENREITMIMSDLRGFTALTTSMPPEKLLAYLNRYLGKMVDILIEYQGIIDEIIGDGILAFFGAPEPLDDHPARAVACALRMQAAMDEINALNEADGLPRIDMGIAVNTGNVVVGNIGSEKRAKYGAVGSQVNFTGRMESFTVGGQVLISSTTYERVADLLDVRNVLEVEMKGIPGKVNLYDIRGIKGSYDVTLPDRADTLIVLSQEVVVQLYRLDEKIVAGAGIEARIVEISLATAVLVLRESIAQWEDVRIVIRDDGMEAVGADAYAKVLSVITVEGRYQAVVRFTSTSPEVQKVFRDAVHSA